MIYFLSQIVNEATCLPPRSVKKDISVEVVDAKKSIKEINQNIFDKLSGIH